MKNTLAFEQQQKQVRQLVEKTLPELLTLKEKENQDAFNKKILKILPEVKKYINGQLNSAINKGHFSKGKYKADDFIDQLFIEVYNHIGEVKNDKHFYLWLFKKTNELLEEVIVYEAFDDLFFRNLDDYSTLEWEEMAENFTIDADGDLLLIEELDNTSYQHKEYTLDQVFVTDTEKELIAQIDKNLSDKDINQHIHMVLQHLPLAMHSVFELFSYQNLTLKEIAEVRNSSVKEVDELLQNTRKAIQVSLFNRYSTN